jgi:hypothetical protein
MVVSIMIENKFKGVRKTKSSTKEIISKKING